MDISQHHLDGVARRQASSFCIGTGTFAKGGVDGYLQQCLSSRAGQLLQLLLTSPFVDRNYRESLYALIHVHRALNVTCFHRGTVSIQV